MEIEKGKIINEAFEILKKTFKEINRLKDDVADLLSDYDSNWKLVDEHSSATKTLYLKHFHSFFFRIIQEEKEVEDISEVQFFVLVTVFQEEWYIKRVNLKDQPELWAILFKIKNKKEEFGKWQIFEHLNFERRKYFKNREVAIGGKVYEYHWIDKKSDEENKEEWEGKFIGYPLVDISSREEIKEKIIDKLFKSE